MTADHYPGKLRFKNTQHGFSLMEVMVVMVIIAILATGVVFMFANPTAKVKTQAFELLGEINYARSVAVKENQNVRIDFTFGTQDSYQICFDLIAGGGCGNEPAGNILKNNILRNDVRFYDFTGANTIPATDAPTRTPSYTSVPAGTNLEDQNGVILHDPTTPGTLLNYLEMQPDGTCLQEGAVVIYLHSQGNKEKIRGAPFAVVIASASTGQVTLSRWRPDLGASGEWSRK